VARRVDVSRDNSRMLVPHTSVIAIDLETTSKVDSAVCCNFVGDGFLESGEGRCSDGVPS
jgi:hypothetical protein